MNWKNIFLKLQAAGLSQNQIAERLGRSQAWVSAASQGKYKDLSWADGNAVLALAKSVCNEAPDFQIQEAA